MVAFIFLSLDSILLLPSPFLLPSLRWTKLPYPVRSALLWAFQPAAVCSTCTHLLIICQVLATDNGSLNLSVFPVIIILPLCLRLLVSLWCISGLPFGCIGFSLLVFTLRFMLWKESSPASPLATIFSIIVTHQLPVKRSLECFVCNSANSLCEINYLKLWLASGFAFKSSWLLICCSEHTFLFVTPQHSQNKTLSFMFHLCNDNK